MTQAGPSSQPFTPTFPSKTNPSPEPPSIQNIINTLNLTPHPEGGYFVETDRDSLTIPNSLPKGPNSTSTRSASTTIFYFLTPSSPLGHFHRNKTRTVHTLHKGRGRYVIIHADEVASEANPGGYTADEGLKEAEKWVGKARIETYVVGQDVAKGERLQWIVDGGQYKCSFLLEDEEGKGSEEGLLISETVVPGFEYEDHDFMEADRLEALVRAKRVEEVAWMVRK